MDALFDELFDSEVAVNIFKLRDAARLGIPTPAYRRAMYPYLLGVAMPDRSREMKIEKAQYESFQALLSTHAKVFRSAGHNTTPMTNNNSTNNNNPSSSTSSTMVAGSNTSTSSTGASSTSSSLPGLTSSSSLSSSSPVPGGGGGGGSTTGAGSGGGSGGGGSPSPGVKGGGGGGSLFSSSNPVFPFSSWLPLHTSTFITGGAAAAAGPRRGAPFVRSSCCGCTSSLAPFSAEDESNVERKRAALQVTPSVEARSCIGASGEESPRGRPVGIPPPSILTGTRNTSGRGTSRGCVPQEDGYRANTFSLFRSFPSSSSCSAGNGGHSAPSGLHVDANGIPTLEWTRQSIRGEREESLGGRCCCGSSSSAAMWDPRGGGVHKGDLPSLLSEWASQVLEVVGPLPMSAYPREAWGVLVYAIQEAYPAHHPALMHWCGDFLERALRSPWREEKKKMRPETSYSSSTSRKQSHKPTSTPSKMMSSTDTSSVVMMTNHTHKNEYVGPPGTSTGSGSHGGDSLSPPPLPNHHHHHHESRSSTSASRSASLPPTSSPDWETKRGGHRNMFSTRIGTAALPPCFPSSFGFEVFTSLGIPFLLAERCQTLSQDACTSSYLMNTGVNIHPHYHHYAGAQNSAETTNTSSYSVNYNYTHSTTDHLGASNTGGSSMGNATSTGASPTSGIASLECPLPTTASVTAAAVDPIPTTTTTVAASPSSSPASVSPSGTTVGSRGWTGRGGSEGGGTIMTGRALTSRASSIDPYRHGSAFSPSFPPSCSSSSSSANPAPPHGYQRCAAHHNDHHRSTSHAHARWSAYAIHHIQKVREHHLLALAALQLYYCDLSLYTFLYQIVPCTFPLAPLFLFSSDANEAKELFFASHALVSMLCQPSQNNILWDKEARQAHCGEFLSLFRWSNPTLYRHFYLEEVRAVEWVPAFLGSLGVGFLQDPENIWRLWDYYMADASTHHRFPLHPYVCLAILMALTERLIECEREEILFLLRHIPSMDMTSILRQAVALKESAANLLQ